MPIEESGKIEEIHRLLDKIDKDSQRIAELESSLEDSERERSQLQEAYEQLKNENNSRNRQQSLMIRERDHAVRDISTELSHISTKLKTREKAETERCKEIRRLKDELYRSDSKLIEANIKIQKKNTKIDSLNLLIDQINSEKIELERLGGMYDELKSQIKFEEVQRQRERKKVMEKAQSLFKSVIEVKEDLTKSEAVLKESLSQSQEKKITHAMKPIGHIICSSDRDVSQLRQAKVGLLNAQNAFLKKKVFKLLNQYFLRDSQQLGETEVPKRTQIFQQNLSECSISESNVIKEGTITVNHKTAQPGTPRSPLNTGLGFLDPKIIKQADQPKNYLIPSLRLSQSEISKSVEVSVSGGTILGMDSGQTSVVGSSHIIGGVTYHMLRNTRAPKLGNLSNERFKSMSSQKRSSRLCLIAAERDSLKELQLSKGKRSSRMFQSRRKQRSSFGHNMLVLEEEEHGQYQMPRPLFPLPGFQNNVSPCLTPKEGENLIKTNMMGSHSQKRKPANKMAILPKSSHQIEISAEKGKKWESIKNSKSKSSCWTEEPLQAQSEVEIEIANDDIEESRVIEFSEVSELPFDEDITHSELEECELFSPITRQNKLYARKRDSDFLNGLSERAEQKNARLKISEGHNLKSENRNLGPQCDALGKVKDWTQSPQMGRKISENLTIKVMGVRDFGRKKRQIQEKDVLNLYNKTIDFNVLPRNENKSSNSRDRTKSAKKRTTPLLTEQLITPKKKKSKLKKVNKKSSIEDQMSLHFSNQSGQKINQFQFNLFDMEQPRIVQSEIFDLAPMKRANQEISEVVKSMSKIKIPGFMTSEIREYPNKNDYNMRKLSGAPHYGTQNRNFDSRTYQISKNHPAVALRESGNHSLGSDYERGPVKKPINPLRQSHHLVLKGRRKKVKEGGKAKRKGRKKRKPILDKSRGGGKTRGKKKNLSSKKHLTKAKYHTLTPKPKKSTRKLTTRHSTRLQNHYASRKTRNTRKSVHILDSNTRSKIRKKLMEPLTDNRINQIRTQKINGKKNVHKKEKRKSQKNYLTEPRFNEENFKQVIKNDQRLQVKSKKKVSLRSRMSSQKIDLVPKKESKSVISQNVDKQSSKGKFNTSKVRNKPLKSKINLKQNLKKTKKSAKKTMIQPIASIKSKIKAKHTKHRLAPKSKHKKHWKEKKKSKKSEKKPPRSSKVSHRHVKKRVKGHKRTLTNLEDLEIAFKTSQNEYSKTQFSNLWKQEFDIGEFSKTDHTKAVKASQNSVDKNNRNSEIINYGEHIGRLTQNVNRPKKKQSSIQKWEALLAQGKGESDLRIESAYDHKTFYKIENSDVNKFNVGNKRLTKTNLENFKIQKLRTINNEISGKRGDKVRAGHLESLSVDKAPPHGLVKKETPCARRRKTIQFE